MRSLLFLTLTLLIGFSASAKKERTQYVEIRTDYGITVVKLYNETPLHKDNFIKLVKDNYYNGLLFHRVIKNFMIQGGDINSREAADGVELGNGDIGYRIPAEFRDNLFHKKGVLAAARDNNPEKESSGAQFYLVQGRIFNDAELDRLEIQRLEGRKIPDYQRDVYKTIGGVPHLDQNYTVFGEVVEGIEVVDEIAEIVTDKRDRPVVNQAMEVRVLKRREVRRLEKRLKKLEKQQLKA